MRIVSGFKRRINLLSFYFLYKSGFYSKNLSLSGGDYILEFHGLDKIGSSMFNWRFIKEEDFKKLVFFLQKVGSIVSLSDIWHHPQHENLRFALTFDDGYQSLKDSLFWLESVKIPASVFITPNETGDKILWTDLLDILRIKSNLKYITLFDKTFVRENKSFIAETTKENLNHFLKHSPKKYIEEFVMNYRPDEQTLSENKSYWVLLNSSDLNELSECALLDIQSHGISHTSFDQLSEAELTHELENSRHWIEKFTRKAVTKVAFPSGKANNDVLRICKNLNYQILLAEDTDFKSKSVKSRIGLYNNGGFYFILDHLVHTIK